MNIKYIIANALFALLLTSGFVQAAELVFTPATPIVEIGQQITLSVSGTRGEITWTPSKGQIRGEGNQVTYIAPAKAGTDVVTVLDEVGNAGTTDNIGLLKITVVSKSLVSLENANWEIFNNRSDIRALLLSDDGKTLWVGTRGGLEQRDASTGLVVRVFTNLDGLQSNDINVLESDSNGGLWIGTGGYVDKGGITYLNASGELTVYTMDNSGLPYNNVRILENDSSGGLWIGSESSLLTLNAIPGLAYRSVSGEWTIYTKDNSGLPFNWVFALESDERGGLWIGTDEGLTYRNANGNWTVYNKDNSELPSNKVNALLHDSNGGLWVGTLSGLAYRSINDEWTVYAEYNSELPSNSIETLETDGNRGLWIGTNSGLAYRSISGEWTVYTKENSELPSNYIRTLETDENRGMWIVTGNGLTYRRANGEWMVYTKDGLPSNSVRLPLRDDKGGLWIRTSSYGLAYRNASSEWTVYTKENSELPSNRIHALLRAHNGGLWIGTEDGLAYLNVNNEWTVYTKENSKLPYNNVRFLLGDGNEGLWILIDPQWNEEENNYNIKGGLAYRHVSGEWAVYTKENSGLPSNEIKSLKSDGRGGLWIVINQDEIFIGDDLFFTGGGLAHRSISGEWTVYNEDNSMLPSNWIDSILPDDSGGLWIGTNSGLAYRSISGEWTVYTKENSELQSNWINVLKSDARGGLWIGTGKSWNKHKGGLAHRSVNGEWTIHTKENSGLPRNEVYALESDDSGGLWTLSGNNYAPDRGTYLAYLSASGKWTVYTKDNSGLPSNWLSAIKSDDGNSLWITHFASGLTRLTFGEKNQVCTQINTKKCETLLTSKRAAIIIAGGGAQLTNSLWDTTEAISNRIYKTFYKRGFDKNEIYYLSPKSWADFNGDGFNDRITRTPEEERNLTVDDVRAALNWAKTAGKLDQPLYLFFVDHGGPGKLQIAPNTQMEADEFKTILDDYQNTTGNELILVIEACYSGSLVKALAAPNRAIISSAKDNELAYFVEKRGFSQFFVDNILRGMNLFEAFNLAIPKQNKLLGKSVPQLSGAANDTTNTSQNPQLDDNADGIFTTDDGQWLKQVYVRNGHEINSLFEINNLVL